MVNTCESVQGPSTRNKPKWLIGLGQKGNVGRSWGLTSPTRGQEPGRSTSGYLRSRTPEAETSKTRILASTGENPIFPPPLAKVHIPQWGQDRSGSPEPTAGKRIVSDAQGGAGVGSWRKRMPSCNGPDTGSEFARRESEQTSRRCLSAKKSMGTIVNRESNGRRRLRSTACAPAFDNVGARWPYASLAEYVQWTRDGLERAGRRESACEVLEPYAGKLSCTVLRGLGGW